MILGYLLHTWVAYTKRRLRGAFTLISTVYFLTFSLQVAQIRSQISHICVSCSNKLRSLRNCERIPQELSLHFAQLEALEATTRERKRNMKTNILTKP